MEHQAHSKQRILIVDDSKATLRILSGLLKDDYTVFMASSGKEALDKAFANPPDLILLDIVMPDLDGYEVYRRLKENEATQNIQIIFITAKSSEDDELQGLSLGAVDYITKPFSLPIVKARVRTHLELKHKTDILESTSSKDGLTGIFNRRHFDKALASEWRRALRNGRDLSVIMLDIDCFKLFNDNYGHPAGDKCLKAVARALSGILRRASDFLARYGGEEFVIILPETKPDAALLVGEKAKQVVEELQIEHKHSNVAPHITISLGIATAVPDQSIDHFILLEQADNALYEAKQSGRNQIKQRYVKHEEIRHGNGDAFKQ